ncbi:MAG: hypothetical protein Greene041619_960 [Candidatus Peregrinibacteria bacterium Greene0416_19]|nr:MAG: hypothetical protein Greene041619_960 [Candidatus Peregrinibacteria bacterium Greene0416_19]
MHRFIPRGTLVLTLTLALALTACGETVNMAPQLRQRLDNPLFAERYWAELTDRLVSIQVNDKSLSADEARRRLVDSLRIEALKNSQAQTAKRREGLLGRFVMVSDETDGLALLLADTLHLSPEFVTYPGPELRLYLSNANDPRDVSFPDPSARDLGLLQSPYGAQSYTAPAAEADAPYRTAVLYDRKLRRMYGFAQLGK